MRGGRTAWYAPLGILFFTFLFAACKLNLNLAEPYLELQINSNYRIYNPQPPLPDDYIQYTFFADEPVLRCRYMLSRNGQFLLSGETEPQTAGVWYNLPLNISELVEGKYQLDLVVQAERSREFVDLGFLKKSISFFRDTTPPAEPEVDLSNAQRFTQQQFVKFSHPEWSEPEPTGSPVTVYYTTDGITDPRDSDKYIPHDGPPVSLPFERGMVTLKAVAKDAAGYQSDVLEVPYYFAHIYANLLNPKEAAVPLAAPITITITGFGFINVAPTDITMTDYAPEGETPHSIEIFISTSGISETVIYFLTQLKYHKVPFDEGYDATKGTATISITVPEDPEHGVGPATVTVPFEIK